MRFLFLPQEHDPDSYIRAYGAPALRACLDEAIPLSRFMLDEMAARHDLAEAEGRAACVHEARPLFAQMPEGGYRLQVEREFAQRVRLTPEELSQMLAQDPGSRRFAPPAAGGGGSQGDAVQGAASRGMAGAFHRPAPDDGPGFDADEPGWMRSLEPDGSAAEGRVASGRQWPGRRSASRLVTPMARRLLRLLLAHPDLVARLGDQQLELLAQHPHLKLVRDLVGLASGCGATHAGALLEAADPDSDLAHAIQDLSTELLAQDLPDPQAEWDDALRALERQTVQEQCDRLIQGGLSTDDERRRYQELSRRLARLKAAAG